MLGTDRRLDAGRPLDPPGASARGPPWPDWLGVLTARDRLPPRDRPRRASPAPGRRRTARRAGDPSCSTPAGWPGSSAYAALPGPSRWRPRGRPRSPGRRGARPAGRPGAPPALSPRCCGRGSRRAAARRPPCRQPGEHWAPTAPRRPAVARATLSRRRPLPCLRQPRRGCSRRPPGESSTSARRVLATGIGLLLDGHDDPRRPRDATREPARVLLHVGTPKTGTSHLQDVLFRNRGRSREHGMLYPADRFDAHFLAALDLMQLRWGGLEDEAVGAWDRLADGGPRVPGHQRSSATRSSPPPRGPQATAPWSRSATAPAPRSTSSLSVRDLVRQIPAEWQENVKHRRELGYGEFLSSSATPRGRGASPRGSGARRRSPTSSTAGAGDLPPERVHLVTVPPPGGPPDLLWQRFSLRLRARRPRPRPRRRARQPLARRPGDRAAAADQPRGQPVVDPAVYRPLVRELLAHQTLSQRLDLAAAHAAAATYPLGRRPLRAPGSRSSSAAATT